MTTDVAGKVNKYRTWLQREPRGRPMMGVLWEPDIPPLPDFVATVGCGHTLSPADIHADTFLPTIERWHQQAGSIPGDVLQPFSPAFGIPWTEAIAGCPVTVHPGSLWAETCLPHYARRETIRFDPHNPWLQKLVEFTRKLVTHSRGRYPVALPQMRGPLDILAAMRTPQQMSLDFLERPEEVSQVLEELTDLWIAIADAVLCEIPPFHGGYCTRMKMWAPGPAITPQNDISTLISPDMYRRFVLSSDRRIVGRFPYSCFHTHASEHHQIRNLLNLESLTAIQLTLEHTLGGPPLEKMLPLAREIVTRKPLLLCALDADTADICLQELPPAGLCVLIGVSGEYDDTQPYAAWLQRQFSAPAN